MSIETIFGEAKPTYFVIREGGRAPQYGHTSRISATKEAERLAHKTPGGVFHVVKLKQTLQNTAASTAPIDDTAAMRAAHARQIIGGMSVGDEVLVAATHHASAGMSGRIVGFVLPPDEQKVPTVLVRFDSYSDTRRFQPQSLTITKKAATERAARCGDIVTFVEASVARQGEIKQVVDRKGQEPGYLIRDIIDNLVMPRTYERGDFRIDTPAEERPEAATKACADAPAANDAGAAFGQLLAALALRGLARRFGIDTDAAGPKPTEDTRSDYQGRQVEVNAEVYIIIADDGPFGVVSSALKGRLTRYDEDERFVWVQIDTDAAPRKVNASRVYAIDDPRIKVVSI